jgi:hypothetical protein
MVEIKNSLLELLLGAELVGVSALALAAVGGTGRETGVALAADHLVAVELGGQSLERGLDDTTTQTEDQVQGGLLLDVVVAQGAAILELLAGEDQALLIRGDALLVLDLGLDVVDRVRGLDLKGDGLARQGLHETAKPDMSVRCIMEKASFPSQPSIAAGASFLLFSLSGNGEISKANGFRESLHLHYTDIVSILVIT